MFFSDEDRFSNKNIVMYNGEIICKGGKKDRERLGPGYYHDGPKTDKRFTMFYNNKILKKLYCFLMFEHNFSLNRLGWTSPSSGLSSPSAVSKSNHYNLLYQLIDVFIFKFQSLVQPCPVKHLLSLM